MQFKSRYREYGGEQAYWPAGPFKIRLPFIHYAWSFPEMFQALFMCATCLGAIPVLTEVLGVSYDVALSMVIINGFFYTLHVLLGDPVVPGWVTPAIPLITAFLTNGYVMGPERTQALVAVQMCLGLIFLVFGITGLGGKMVKVVPNSVKAGVLMGGGIAAVLGEFKANGRFDKYPISVAIGIAVAYFCLFSPIWADMRRKNKIIDAIGKFGMLPAILVGVIVGPIAGEFAIPHVQWWPLIKVPDFADIWNQLSPFAIGWPSMKIWAAAVPVAIVTYIIAFGDFVTSEALIHEADEVRQDEKIDFNANRSNLVSGVRNVAMAMTCPYTQMCGPLWAAVTAAVSQRYKESPKSMESIYSGFGTFRLSTFVAVALLPISSLLQPVLPVALSLTLIVQGYICTQLAMNMCKTNIERGICGVMGAVLAMRGAAWGLVVGLILFAMLYESNKKETAKQAEKAEN
ncbi:membrane protein [Treponema sp. OMZ 838]|nr:membrane protein [Treponema sp. OMZ 838]